MHVTELCGHALEALFRFCELHRADCWSLRIGWQKCMAAAKLMYQLLHVTELCGCALDALFNYIEHTLQHFAADCWSLRIGWQTFKVQRFIARLQHCSVMICAFDRIAFGSNCHNVTKGSEGLPCGLNQRHVKATIPVHPDEG